MKTRSLLLVGLISTVSFFSLLTQHASAQELEGVGSIRFQLRGPETEPDLIGSWTLVRPGNQRTEGSDNDFAFDELDAGVYTFSTSLPQGTSATMTLLLNGQEIKKVEVPQISIPLDGQDSFFIKVDYHFARTGTVSVNSTPAGLSFTLKGPNDKETRGTTPFSYEGVEGQWTAYFDQIEGCPKLPAQSDKLVKDSRVTLSVNVVCENLKDTDIGRQQEKSLEFVTISIDGHPVVFKDVRTSDWFAPFVSKVAKAGVISGYKDANGNPEGRFGAGDNVTIAQLAKIAHEMAGIDETKVRVPVQNLRARNQWFEQYFASAEQQWWDVWRDIRIDPTRNAKRGEVIATVLRALGVRTAWAEGKTFGDVLPTHRYANAIETAAADGLVDTGGNFRPDDPINRAEIAKIVSNAVGLYIEDTLEVQGGSR